MPPVPVAAEDDAAADWELEFPPFPPVAFPPLPPFTNSLPSYAIILIAASMMEEDGITIWVGYAVAVAAMVYLGLVAGALRGVFIAIYHFFQHWFG